MEFRAGALLIGSLLWDTGKARPAWRRTHLNMGLGEFVRVPIRYGRISHSRGDTHTMVFSKLCYRQKELGIGFVAPFSGPISSTEDLLAEAQHLADAEGLGNAWTWGAIALKANPSARLPREMKAAWSLYFAQRASGCEVLRTCARSERPPISRNGLLALRWPTSVKTGKPVTLDFILATPTKATLDRRRYPRSAQIAETYVYHNDPEYFLENVAHGIRTSQDAILWKTMARLKPEWETTYAHIGRILNT